MAPKRLRQIRAASNGSGSLEHEPYLITAGLDAPRPGRVSAYFHHRFGESRQSSGFGSPHDDSEQTYLDKLYLQDDLKAGFRGRHEQEDMPRPPPRQDPDEETGKRVERLHFDPARSLNPFVNGAALYRFVWGKPLCVKCGTTGHLPAQCPNEPLSGPEQEYLYIIMRKEQNRSKAARGIGRYELTSSLEQTRAPSLERPSTRDESVPHFIAGQGAPSRIEHWRRGDSQPLSEGTSSASGRPGVDEQRRNAWSRVPLESQDDEFDRFHTERQTWHPMPMPFLPPPPPPQSALDEYKLARGSNSTNTQDAGKAKASKRKKKSKEKRDNRSEVNFHSPAKANADTLLLPQAFDSSVGQQEIPTQSRPVATAANAVKKLRLIPLHIRKMGASVRLSNGEAQAVGPHPSTIRVSARYLTQAAIEKYLSPTSLDPQERSQAEAREDSLRLQGVAWIDNVRRALQLPVKTYTSACVFYHKFRLAHPFHEYSFADAAAASLLNACKAEDTLKKSRDILAAAYNLKQPAGHEHVSADDPIFDGPSRTIIGLERLVLESSSFDFTNRAPHDMLVKVAKSLPRSEDTKPVCRLAWIVLTDIHRTFAPLKQTSATLSLACLELAAHFTASSSPDHSCVVSDHLQELDLSRWHTTRGEVMEILLDALDMYTHHTTQTILGSQYSLDDFLRIRLALNKECTDSNIPRHTTVQTPSSPDNRGTCTTLRVSNGHPTPISPPQAGSQAPPQPVETIASPPVPEGGGTLRFMLNPQRATDERADVRKYYTEEYEEYEEEIEVPIHREHSRDRDRDHSRRRDYRDDRYDDGRRSVRDDRGPPLPPAPMRDREREREPLRDRERDAERERARMRERDRDRRYDDRRYDDRERDRRFDDRRDRDRDRRYYEDDRRRRDDRR